MSTIGEFEGPGSQQLKGSNIGSLGCSSTAYCAFRDTNIRRLGDSEVETRNSDISSLGRYDIDPIKGSDISALVRHSIV